MGIAHASAQLGGTGSGESHLDPSLMPKLLFGLEGIDLSSLLLDRQALEGWLPHRGTMMLIDGIVWSNEDFGRGMAVKHVRDDEFWVPGHFPNQAMLPGVLQIESAAQLACYLYNRRQPKPRIAAFTRLDETVFRNAVVPGDTLYIQCEEIKYSERRFISRVMGVTRDKIAFEAKITGMSLGYMDEA